MIPGNDGTKDNGTKEDENYCQLWVNGVPASGWNRDKVYVYVLKSGKLKVEFNEITIGWQTKTKTKISGTLFED